MRTKKRAVDYSDFSFLKLADKKYNHLLYLLGWVGYFVMYLLTENLIPYEICTPIHCPLDDLIPFCELFAIAYVGWYLLIIASLVYFMLYNPDNFKNMMKFLIITQICAMVIYLIFPSCHNLRPTEFARKNILTGIMSLIYRIDTPTNIWPSLHVAFSLGIASTWLRERSASPFTKAVIALFCLLVCLSVVFVKQHSVLDILAAIPVALLAEILTFWIKSPVFKPKKRGARGGLTFYKYI